jgi:hypothetical protein
MRSVLAVGLLITLCATANAASLQRSRPGTVHSRGHQHVSVRPSPDVTGPRFAVPGWSDEQTLQWLDNASSGWTQA